MDKIFSTYQEIARYSRNRHIFLFGAGEVAEKTKRKLTRIDGIVDNNPDLQQTTQLECNIESPAILGGIDPKPYIIICATSFTEIREQLLGLGFSPVTDFVVSPVLNDLRVIQNLEEHTVDLLFTSGIPPLDAPQAGGGLYHLKLRGEDWSYQKVYSGNCHGLIQKDDTYIVIDDEHGILQLDPDFQIIVTKKLPKGVRPHGVTWNPDYKNYFVSCSYSDSFLTLDSKFEIISETKFTNKHTHFGLPFHHCNDIYSIGSSVYVSMFSLTGNWKRNVFDGGVVEYDIETQSRIGNIVTDLWMPHNITSIDGSLTVLDSLRGRLLKNNMSTTGVFPAFTRGLAHDGEFFYIGQSRNRNYGSLLGNSYNISIDTGIVVFDEITKTSRFMQLPSRLSEIHSILVI